MERRITECSLCLLVQNYEKTFLTPLIVTVGSFCDQNGPALLDKSVGAAVHMEQKAVEQHKLK